MATGTESAPLSPSSGGSDLEEGELVPGNDGSAGPDLEEGEFVAGPDDGIRHVGDGLPESKRRGLELEGIVVDGGSPLPSPTPSCDHGRDSDGAVTDVDVDVDADAGAASLAQDPLFPGPVCRMEFTSQKAVSGHVMSAHGPRGRLQGNEERPAVGGGWDVTGTRPDSVGGRSVSSESEGVVDPTATVASEPVLDPMPLAFSSSSSSAEPNPPDDDSMDIDVEPPRNHTNKIVVRPPCSPQFLQGRRPAAPRVLVAQDRPTVAQGHQLAEDAARQFVLRQAAAAQAVAHHVQRTSLPRAGGHMSGHTARKKNEELAAAGIRLGVGDPKPAKLHPFTHCPSVFASGGQLGGHMRKHYEGNVAPMPPKKPVIDPMPIASASRSSSAEPNPPNADSVAIGVESSGNHANKVVVRPPCSPRSLQGQQPAAPEVVVAQDQPTVAQGQQLPEEAARQFFVRQAAEPQAVAHHVQHASPPRPERDEYGYWFCREKGCGARFLSYSGLGSHISCHTARKRIELAAASVFASGGQLGGHMRKHYEGNVAPRKPVIDPMPIPFASQSSSAEPNPPPNDDSVAIVVESSGNHTNKAIVRPPCSPRFLQGHQPAAPQVVVAQAQPTVAQGHQHAEAAARQFVPHKAAAPQVAAHHAQRTLPPPPPPARDEQGWWLCKEEGCDQRYATPQELGVHMLSHNMGQDSEAAAVALHLGIGPATFHPCKHCPSVFTSGKQLGSHMRKHYEGNVTPKKPGATPNVSARELASALAPPVPMPPATMEVTPAQPAVAPSTPVLPVPGGPRISRVNFVVSPPPGAAAEESSSVVTETDQSSGASTDMEQ